ncbi:PREDICTED: uncharacterized protein LOC105961467 [Erythranthe guttata]|uniref:uncharacterized protein LOC105961458 n=1 Tax=Erythranthe guttata TaxID=4155 RepID=UPI00064DCED3|nr:PREDICTED: uncharacterized protein LOC105961458 [Erythranthe guttata]XP_012841151.1 PREDICTED: uncharacterized protein LOC105961467 [Erythranthe guttata]|eukprot:XP_012841144.1 PREDICTED: uncharacterized protein LOC105961458 [Erythranthe guttata]
MNVCSCCRALRRALPAACCILTEVKRQCVRKYNRLPNLITGTMKQDYAEVSTWICLCCSEMIRMEHPGFCIRSCFPISLRIQSNFSTICNCPVSFIFFLSVLFLLSRWS